MSKQLSPTQWKNSFKKYESYSQPKFWNYYARFKPNRIVNKDHKKRFKNIYNVYKRGETSIIHSMTRRKKASGRKKTSKIKKKKKIDWDIFTREDLIKIAERYKEIIEEKKKKDKMKEAKNLDLWIFKLVILLGISKSGYYKNRSITYKSRRDPRLEVIITETFYTNKKIYGRKRIAKYIEQNNDITVSDRTVGNYLKALGLICITRQTKKRREQKNTNVEYKNLVKRDYNNINVIATDVSYIPIKSSLSKHAYLSIAINHKTKFIESWNLHLRNNNYLVMKHFKGMNLKNKIIHSDHGSQYSSNEFSTFIKEAGAKISMSRVGNSLDNREAEYFFSNIKSECCNHIKTNRMTVDETKVKVNEYIKWYNYKRIQSRLKWKTPAFARV